MSLGIGMKYHDKDVLWYLPFPDHIPSLANLQDIVSDYREFDIFRSLEVLIYASVAGIRTLHWTTYIPIGEGKKCTLSPARRGYL